MDPMKYKNTIFGGVFLGLACFLTLASVEASLAKTAKSNYDDPDGYAVLSVLLDRSKFGLKDSVIYISPTTVPEASMLSSLKCSKKPDGFQSAISDFHEKNKIAAQLTAKFSMGSKYELSDNPEKDLPSPKPGEPELHLQTHIPIYVVSSVGFDPSRTRSVAYVSVFCGGECGGGAYHFLLKEEKGWKEVTGSPACEWVSQIQPLLKAWKPS